MERAAWASRPACGRLSRDLPHTARLIILGNRSRYLRHIGPHHDDLEEIAGAVVDEFNGTQADRWIGLTVMFNT